jgi:hypothetical protein
MRHTWHNSYKDRFIEGFINSIRTALFVAGYVIIGVLILAAVAPSLKIMESIVDGSALKLIAYACFVLVALGITNGVAHLVTTRSRSSYSRHNRTQLAK